MDKVVVLVKLLEINREKRLGTKAIAMYVILLEAWNGLDSFQMTDGALAVQIGCSRNAVSGARETLSSAGLIDYETKRGKACKYYVKGASGLSPLTLADHKTNTSAPLEKEKGDRTNRPTNSPGVKPSVAQGKIKTPQKAENIVVENGNDKRNPSIPTLKKFLNYIRLSFEDYRAELDHIIIDKYNMWVANGWRNGMDRPIFNWRGAVRGNWKYWTSLSPTIGAFSDLSKIPHKTLPKITYNED